MMKSFLFAALTLALACAAEVAAPQCDAPGALPVCAEGLVSVCCSDGQESGAAECLESGPVCVGGGRMRCADEFDVVAGEPCR